MPVPSILKALGGAFLHTEKIGRSTHLIIEQHARVATQSKSATHTTAATTAVATPPPGQAIVVTDITVSGEKINAGIITIQWADGTDTDVIYKGHVTDGPVNLHIAYQGRKLGWKGARVDFITSTANQDATVTISYYFVVKGGLVRTFADWDKLRN